MKDFHQDLDRSELEQDNPIIREIYAKYFPNMSSMTAVKRDTYGQMIGIDRILVLNNSKTVKVEEKLRYADYGDILLELWSDVEKKKPGWAVKDLECDYIAYIILPSKTGYVWPYLAFKRAMEKDLKLWMTFGDLRETKNKGYYTQNLSVPTSVFLTSIASHMKVELI